MKTQWGIFCPRAIINISFGLCMRSQSLPEVGVFSMRLRSVQWLLMPESYGVKAYSASLSCLHCMFQRRRLCFALGR